MSKELPNRRWLTRKMVISYVGSWRELRRLEDAGNLVPQYPGGIKHKRYVRSEVIAALSSK